jgi:hypothetical protein
MTNAQKVAKAKILDACHKPSYREDIAQQCVVLGEFGLSAWGVSQLIKSMIAEGSLVVTYDSLSCPKIVTA